MKQLGKPEKQNMKKIYQIITIFLICILSEPVHTFEIKTLNFVNEHWPPFVIHTQPQPSGIDIEIAQKIAENLKVTLNITKCDWYYCLKMMEHGRVDIISSAFRTQEREKYMLFIEPPYILHSIKLFYLKKGKGIKIEKYNDLYDIRIGLLKGSAYFDQFDKDSKIKKIEVLKTEQLLSMVINDRIDAFIGTELVADYLIRANQYNGVFAKSSYRYVSKSPFYFAISKQSSFSKNIDKINNIMKSLRKTGQIQSIIDKYTGAKAH